MGSMVAPSAIGTISYTFSTKGCSLFCRWIQQPDDLDIYGRSATVIHINRMKQHWNGEKTDNKLLVDR